MKLCCLKRPSVAQFRSDFEAACNREEKKNGMTNELCQTSGKKSIFHGKDMQKKLFRPILVLHFFTYTAPASSSSSAQGCQPWVYCCNSYYCRCQPWSWLVNPLDIRITAPQWPYTTRAEINLFIILLLLLMAPCWGGKGWIWFWNGNLKKETLESILVPSQQPCCDFCPK